MGRDRLTVRQAAQEAGVPTRTMLRRVVALHSEYGGILFDTNERPVPRVRRARVKFLIDIDALERCRRKHPDQNEVEHDFLTALISDMGQKVEALRKSHNRLKRRVDLAMRR